MSTRPVRVVSASDKPLTLSVNVSSAPRSSVVKASTVVLRELISPAFVLTPVSVLVTRSVKALIKPVSVATSVATSVLVARVVSVVLI